MRIGLALVVAVALAAQVVAGPAPQKDVRSALAEGSRLEAAGDARGAMESYLWALEASRPGTDERGHALLSLSQVEAGLGKYAESNRHAANATAIFEGLGDRRYASFARNRQAANEIFAGNYTEAERLLRSALADATAVGDAEMRAEQLTNFANVQFYFGRYVEAAHYYQESLDIANAAGDQPWAARRRRITLANKASLQLRLGQYQQALATFDQLDAASAELRPRERAEVLVNRGVLYRRLGDPIKALAAYEEARTLFARDGLADGELAALQNEGIVLALDLGRLGEARRNFTIALETATRAGNKHGMLHARIYRGETNLRDRSVDAARDDYVAGLALARELRTPEEEWKALYGLGRVAANPSDAVGYLEQAVKTIEAVREGIRVQSLRTDFLSDKREVYDALIKAKLAGGAAPEIFQLLERSHSRVWRDRLGLAGTIDLASIQRVLPAGALLLDYWHSSQGAAVIAVSRSRAAVIPLEVDERTLVSLIDAMSGGTVQRLAPDRARSRQAPAAAAGVVRRRRSRAGRARRAAGAGAVRRAAGRRRDADRARGGHRTHRRRPRCCASPRTAAPGCRRGAWNCASSRIRWWRRRISTIRRRCADGSPRPRTRRAASPVSSPGARRCTSGPTTARPCSWPAWSARRSCTWRRTPWRTTARWSVRASCSRPPRDRRAARTTCS